MTLIAEPTIDPRNGPETIIAQKACDLAASLREGASLEPAALADALEEIAEMISVLAHASQHVSLFPNTDCPDWCSVNRREGGH